MNDVTDTTPFCVSISNDEISTTEDEKLSQMTKCPICFDDTELSESPNDPICTSSPPHIPPCLSCLFEYFKTTLTEYRHVSCPICEKDINFTLLQKVMEWNHHVEEFNQYDSRLLEQCLKRDPNAKFCPHPDCPYVAIVPNCKKCPQLTCPRCSNDFCGMCQEKWHPDQICSGYASVLANNIKKCPNCSTHIEKVNDGSCNLISCQICQKKFCWLCGREASELHFWSPSGCTYFGNNRWDVRRTNYCQLCILLTAPLIIFLLTIFALFGIFIALPILAGFLLNKITWKYKCLKITVITIVVTVLILLSPILYILFVILAVPLMYLFFYIIMPIYLCKKGLCCRCRGFQMDQEEIS